MKRFLFILTSVFITSMFLSNTMIGQKYHPMLNNSKWRDVYPFAVGEVWYYTAGNIILSGTKYVKIASTNSAYFTYMREDTVARKVYLYDDVSATERMLYNFNWNIGDSVFVGKAINDPDSILKVSKIDTVTSPIGPLKRFYLNNGSAIVVEAVGSHFMFDAIRPPVYDLEWFGCAYQNNQFIYSNPSVQDCPGCLTVTVTTTPATLGQFDGSATANVTGGTAPYTYSWVPFGGTTQTINGIQCGGYTVNVIDSYGCTGVIWTYVTCVTGIDELSAGMFKVYPNPAATNVAIETERSISCNIQLINLLGETVFDVRQPIANKMTIDVGTLPKGIYIVQLQDNNNNTFGRQTLVVQ